MLSALGFIMIGGIILAVVALIMLIIASIRKQPKKLSIILLVIGIALPIAATVVGLVVSPDSADYTVTTKAEGKDFIDNATTKKVRGKTLEFKVTEVGDESQMGVGLAAPGGFNVLLPVTKEARKIKVGDTVTVECNAVGDTFGIPAVSATLE
ncbi:hypothetical protein [Lacticaseibacillus sharpeae]|uniref:Uncharacterized protein n=1 Tax=Lacticaseibacillus sharpeae JCM 1186 = DSM 20505 TaxID=1291052 RepID=A0A0R1ZKY8_9LACO|nr:hypothetical protein [Lacticaseibacillus sharpeae]KRM55050.1 hypothetical protein FC18_GL001758 [Lacticaseibacillus sharpeae JCM 1186 = DSM 20505]